jgi:hypothetical protein
MYVFAAWRDIELKIVRRRGFTLSVDCGWYENAMRCRVWMDVES